MRKSQAFFQLIKRVVVVLNTRIARSWFAGWGKRSRLGLGAQLDSVHLVLVGSDVAISAHAWFNAHDDRGDGMPTLRIGDGTYIGRFFHVNAWREVSIGTNVLIADRVFISDASHEFADIAMPIRRQGDKFQGAVSLLDGCWIGTGAVILPGLTIGRNAVVGANSVVTKSVPDFAVVAGNPAKIIRVLNNP